MTELVGIPSVSGTRETVTAARAIVARLRAAGFSEADAFVTGPVDTIGGVFARLRGRTQGEPLLLMAHLDVVPAAREDWSTDPFTLIEQEGWWYGRGTSDNKAGVAIIAANLIQWKREGYVPDRDIVAILTGDEESSGNQAAWFADGEGRRHIGDPVLAVNLDVGGGTLDGGRASILDVQTGEKIYVSYHLTVRNPGGHSARPRPDNAIYSLARALLGIEAFRFPMEISSTKRLDLERSAAFEPDSIARLMRAIAQNPRDTVSASRLSHGFNNSVRTTCVATMLAGGHAENALPQTARATVNCRMMPGSDTAAVLGALKTAVADTAVEFTEIQPAILSPTSALTPERLGVIERVASQFWPGVVVIPIMSSGASDGAFLRNAGIPVYGISGIFRDTSPSGAHGRDERMEIRRFYEGLEFNKALVEALAAMD